MKKKLMNSLSIGNRMISENSNITNKKMVIHLLTLFSFTDHLYPDQQASLIYYGSNPLTFLLLFIASYLFGYKVIKVLSMEQLQEKILSSTNPIAFLDKENYSDEVLRMTRYKSFVAFRTHNLTLNLKMTAFNHVATWDYLKKKQKEYESRSHGLLMGELKSLENSALLIYDFIVMEMPTSGIHSPTKHIGFSKENINSIVNLISHLPHLLSHTEIRICSTIETSFFYMLSVYVNQKTLLTDVTSRSNLSVTLYGNKQAAIIDGGYLMYLWNIMLKDYVFSNKYELFNGPFLKWIIGLKIRKLLREFFGRSLNSLYIINADIPLEVKQLLRNSFLKVVFLYGIRETGNIIGSNTKKDKLSLDSYKIENLGDDIQMADDDVSNVLFIKGNAVADSLEREIISNSIKEEELYVSTYDFGTVKGDILYFISPIGTAINAKDHFNFNLYFAERSLLALLPEILHTVSFDYKNNWYIAVQVDIDYLNRRNLNIEDVERKLNEIKRKINIYISPSDVIRGIEVSTETILLNFEGKPVRFVHKMEDNF